MMIMSCISITCIYQLPKVIYEAEEKKEGKISNKILGSVFEMF